MKSCKCHSPSHLSPPEAHANARCRGSGPPNEQRPGGNRGAEAVIGGGVNQQAQPTATAAHLQRLAALYGSKGGAS